MKNTIEQIKTMRNGTVIDSFSGRITKVYEQKTGVGEFGPWHLQNLIVADDTGQVQATWSGEDPFDIEAEGQTWHFESAEGKKGLAGLKWEIRNKNGKTYQSVKMDDRCKIKPVNGGDATCSEQHQESTQVPLSNAAPTSDPESAATYPDAVHDNRPAYGGKPMEDGITETRRHLMQSANLMLLAIRATMYVGEQSPEALRTEERYGAVLGQLFKEASNKRTNDGINWFSYVDKMPTHPIK